MLKISNEQKQVISKYIDNLQELLQRGDVNELLTAIDDIIIYNLDEDDELDEIGLKLQPIYDQIYNQNV